MRRLSLTLMLVVVLSIVGAGWAVDRLFAVLDTQSSDAIRTAEQLGYQLVDLLDSSNQVELDSVASMDSSEHDIYTIARDSIVLPATLEKQLESRQAVALESKDAVTHTSERRVEVDENAVGASILADERCTLMLVNNLLQNAVKFSNSVVRLTISSRDRRVFLRIEDDGPGFNIGDTERLLKPFQKGAREQEAQSVARGYGLGLAIVERIARWQGATITLGNSVDLKGACVTVDFAAV